MNRIGRRALRKGFRKNKCVVEYRAMKKIAMLCVGLFLPFQVSALEYKNLSLLYTDAPFTPAESAGISLLTSIGAVQGNPDGTFRPNRTINRAEFLKIVLASYPKIRVSASDADHCFPDVSVHDWFAPYVCLAKKRGMVKGYDDGQFKPNRNVNYAEALKILGELYEYIAYSADDEEWYAGYVRAAEYNKTALPSSIKFDRSLTRGQMARLAAAYRANEEGELETYRLAEKDLDLVIEQQKMASQASSSSAAAASQAASSESSTSSIVTELFPMPATSHFLLLGTREMIASGYFVPREGRALIRNVTVKFRKEPRNVRSVYLVDSKGKRIAELQPDIYDQQDLTWKSNGNFTIDYAIPEAGKQLGVEVLLQDRDNGFANELISVKWISMNVEAIEGNDAYQLIAANASYPAHQTVQSRLTSIQSNMPPVVDLTNGKGILLAETQFKGEILGGAELQIKNLTYTISNMNGVHISNFRIGMSQNDNTSPCSLGEGRFINCLNIPASIGMIDDNGSTLLQLWGDMEINESITNPELQIDILKPGEISTTISPGEIGDVLWSDGSGDYKWLEMQNPIATGNTWR